MNASPQAKTSSGGTNLQILHLRCAEIAQSVMMRKPHVTCHINQTQTVGLQTSADNNPIFGEVCTPAMGDTEKSFLFLISPVHKGLHFPLCLRGRSYCLRLKGNSQWLQQRLMREKEWMSRDMQEGEKEWEKRYEAQNISVCRQADFQELKIYESQQQESLFFMPSCECIRVCACDCRNHRGV